MHVVDFALYVLGIVAILATLYAGRDVEGKR